MKIKKWFIKNNVVQITMDRSEALIWIATLLAILAVDKVITMKFALKDKGKKVNILGK